MESITVLGLGRVGGLAAELLVESNMDVVGYDATIHAAATHEIRSLDVADGDALARALEGHDTVLSCLPYQLNRSVADVAHERGIHYFDLTEDVATTEHIMGLAESGGALLAPQCGLAPGFVGIVGAHLIAQFNECRSCRMRVGALPQNPTGLMGYSFNWSPEGVVNEYLNDCEVLEDGERKWVSPMEWLERIHIGGVELEAFTTSGGLGTMCATYLGRVPNLDYKTMRYPGHAVLMNFFFHELLMRERRADAGEILVNAKPPVDEDVVYVHVAAEGLVDGRLGRREFVRAYHPRTVAGSVRTAIAWTTASSVVAVIELARSGALPTRGFLRQEDIPLDAFLATRAGSAYGRGGRTSPEIGA